MEATFDMDYWRRKYEECKRIGRILKEKTDANRRFFLTGEAVDLIEQTDALRRECDRYLEHCGIKAAKQKWKYNNKDTTTWLSSDDFAYSHLV